MKEDVKSQRRILFFALLASLVLHALFILLFPTAERRAEPEQIMTVRLVASKSEKKSAPEVNKPKSEGAAKKTEQKAEQKKKEPVKAVSKIKEQKSTVNKRINKTADIPAEKSAPEAGTETQAQQGSDTAGISGADLGKEGGIGGSGLSKETGGIVDASVLTVTKKVIPDYPSFSRKRKEEGTVYIIVTIEHKGVVKSEIERTSGYDRLDASAERAAKQWKFDCEDRVRARIPFVFKLK